MKVVEKLKKPEANTIKALEDLLKGAKEGEIVGMCYAVIHSDGLCHNGKVGMLDWQPNRMAGAITNGLLRYQLGHVLEYVPRD